MFAVAFYPKLGRVVLLNAVAVVMVAVGLYLFHLDSPTAAALPGAGLAVVFLRLLGFITLMLATLAVLLVAPPFLQGVVRRSATLELLDDGFVLAVGLDQRRKVSWSDTSWVQSVRLKPPLQVGWVTIAFAQPRRGLGRELSVPDLYLDRRVEEVVEAMNSKLERWRHPWGSPEGQESSS